MHGLSFDEVINITHGVTHFPIDPIEFMILLTILPRFFNDIKTIALQMIVFLRAINQNPVGFGVNR